MKNPVSGELRTPKETKNSPVNDTLKIRNGTASLHIVDDPYTIEQALSYILKHRNLEK